MQANNIAIGLGGAVSAALLASVITWGLGMETRLELMERFAEKGERFTQQEGNKLLEKIQANHDLELVIETKLDFLIKEIEELKHKKD